MGQIPRPFFLNTITTSMKTSSHPLSSCFSLVIIQAPTPFSTSTLSWKYSIEELTEHRLRREEQGDYLYIMQENKILNVNVGILGHVDSGKTSLARAISTLLSTAALDKSPASQERGITLGMFNEERQEVF